MQTSKCVNSSMIQEWQIINDKNFPLVSNIKDAIETKSFDYARDLLQLMIAIDIENPQSYNLLGIIYEKEGDRKNATKWYRVAYYIDQTYKPASKNLDRISNFDYSKPNEVEWGIQVLEVKK